MNDKVTVTLPAEELKRFKKWQKQFAAKEAEEKALAENEKKIEKYQKRFEERVYRLNNVLDEFDTGSFYEPPDDIDDALDIIKQAKAELDEMQGHINAGRKILASMKKSISN